VKALTELKVADLLKECNTSFEDQWELIDSALKRLKQRLIEEALEAERTELVSCSYAQRTPLRTDYRNGYWKRWLLLKDGRLELRMPRLRNSTYESQIVPRYVQRMPEVDEALKRVFLFGERIAIEIGRSDAAVCKLDLLHHRRAYAKNNAALRLRAIKRGSKVTERDLLTETIADPQ